MWKIKREVTEMKEGKKKVSKIDERLKEFDLSKRKELLEEKQLLLKQKESIDVKIRNINGQLEALDRYLLHGDKS
jgi:hypothetical protein